MCTSKGPWPWVLVSTVPQLGVCCCHLRCCLQHTPLIPMMALVMAHGLSQDLFEKYKVTGALS